MSGIDLRNLGEDVITNKNDANDVMSTYFTDTAGLEHKLFSEEGYDYAVALDDDGNITNDITYMQSEDSPEAMEVGDDISFSSSDSIVNTALVSSRRYLTATQTAANASAEGDMAVLHGTVVALGLEGAKNDMTQTVLKKDLEQRSKANQQLSKG
jgi:hypothetical protein